MSRTYERSTTPRTMSKATYDRRAMKRQEGATASGFDVYQAFMLGQYAGAFSHSARNPYPPGRRHDEWERGFNLARH